MELKVWVDGIQKVLCGASYTTTCQDVVVALASAMGRTGRFTLIEKWRDTERSLIPAECPLQSLHKWGEYAGEVKYYLVHAEADSVRQEEKNSLKINTLAQNKYQFVHNFTPPHTSQRHLYQSRPEFIKRSSTFSGAHNTSHRASSSSSSSGSSSLTALSENSTSVSLASAAARDEHTRFPLALNKADLLPPVSTSSSASLSSLSAKDIHADCATRQPVSASLLQQVREDAGEFHPTDVPEALSPFSKNYSLSFYETQSPSQQSSEHSLSSHQTHQPKPPEQIHHPLVASSKQGYSLSDEHHHSTTMVTTSQSYHDRQQQQQLIFSSQLSIPQSNHSKLLPPPIAAPRHQTGASVSKESISANTNNHQKVPDQREFHSNSQTKSSAKIQTDIVNLSEDHNNDREVVTGCSHFQAKNETVSNPFHNGSTEAVIKYVPENRILQDPVTISDKNAHESLKSQTFKDHQKCRPELFVSTTLDRHITRSKYNQGLPSKSLSICGGGEEYRSSDEKLLDRLDPTSDLNSVQKSGGEIKVSSPNSAFVRQQLAGTGSTSGRFMSSFASAVAHVRQHSGDALLKQSETHVRQHSSDSSKIDDSFRGRFTSAQITTLAGDLNSGSCSSKPQPNAKPLVSVSSPSSPVFTDTSVKSHGQISSTSFTSEIHNIHNESCKQNTFDAVSEGPSNNNWNQRSSSVGQVSLEIEEYDLDKNFPDVLQRETVNNGGEHPQVTSTSRQSEGEYIELLRIVKSQQERMKVQEAQIKDADLEITTLTTEESGDQTNLEATVAELSKLEKQETDAKVELESLHKTEWMNVVEREQVLEKNIKIQMKNLKSRLEQMEFQMKQLQVEEEKKSAELSSQKKKADLMKKKTEELDEKTMIEVKQLEDELSGLAKMIDENNHRLQKVESEIQKVDTGLKQQESKAKSLQEELNSETKDPCSIATIFPQIPVTSNTDFASSGEAILKILEGQLSANSSPTFSREDGGDILHSTTPVQYLYSSAVAAKSSTGVWV